MLERFKTNEWVILRVDKNSSRRHLWSLHHGLYSANQDLWSCAYTIQAIFIWPARRQLNFGLTAFTSIISYEVCVVVCGSNTISIWTELTSTAADTAQTPETWRGKALDRECPKWVTAQTVMIPFACAPWIDNSPVVLRGYLPCLRKTYSFLKCRCRHSHLRYWSNLFGMLQGLRLLPNRVCQSCRIGI